MKRVVRIVGGPFKAGRTWPILIAIGIGALWTCAAPADVITLRNGDRYSGTLANIANGTLSFRTKLAGKVYVSVSEITSVTTDSFVLVTMDDDRILTGTIRSRDGEAFVVGRSDGQWRPIDLQDVRQVKTIPASDVVRQETGKAPRTPATDVTLETGYRFRTGTVDRSSAIAGFEIDARGDNTEASVGATGEISEDGAQLDRFFDAEARVSGTSEAPIRPEVGLEIERNLDKAIDLRADVSAGARGTVLDSDSQQLEGFAGLGATIERFDDDVLRSELGDDLGPRAGSDGNEELGLDLQLNYRRALLWELLLEEELVFRPSLTEMGDFRSRLESSLHVPITSRIKLRFHVFLDYEEKPEYRGIERLNTALGASLRLNF